MTEETALKLIKAIEELSDKLPLMPSPTYVPVPAYPLVAPWPIPYRTAPYWQPYIGYSAVSTGCLNTKTDGTYLVNGDGGTVC